MSTATLDARLRLNSADFHGGLNKASRDTKKVAAEMQGSFEQMRGVLTGGLGIAFGATAIKAIFDARIEFEKMQAAMTATMGSAALGQQTLSEIKKMAGDIGIGVSSAAKAFIQFQSAGMQTAEAFKMIRAGYNAIISTGGGEAEFSRFAVAVQQLRNSPKPLQEEINQLREALPTTAKLMQEAFGVQRAEDLQDLNVSGKEFVETIGELLVKLPQVGDTLGKQQGRLKTLWNDFLASLGDSFLMDLGQGAMAAAAHFIGTAGEVKAVLQEGLERAAGVYDPDEKKRLKEQAEVAQERLDMEKPAPFGKLSAEDIEEWKKSNEKWREERQRQRKKTEEEERETWERLAGWEVEWQIAKAERRSQEIEQIIAETQAELEKMEADREAALNARINAMQGVADAREIVEGKLAEEINKNIENRLKTRGERRAERDEERRFEKAKNAEESALAKKMLKESRDEFKKNELDNLKKGKFWNEEMEKMKARADAQEAVKKATQDGAMTLKDILVVLKTLATA
jgi:tape measure domain-containing protein